MVSPRQVRRSPQQNWEQTEYPAPKTRFQRLKETVGRNQGLCFALFVSAIIFGLSRWNQGSGQPLPKVTTKQSPQDKAIADLATLAGVVQKASHDKWEKDVEAGADVASESFVGASSLRDGGTQPKGKETPSNNRHIDTFFAEPLSVRPVEVPSADPEASDMHEPFVGASSINESIPNYQFWSGYENAKEAVRNQVHKISHKVHKIFGNDSTKGASPQSLSEDAIAAQETEDLLALATDKWGDRWERAAAAQETEDLLGSATDKWGDRWERAAAAQETEDLLGSATDKWGDRLERAEAAQETEDLLDLATDKWGDRLERAAAANATKATAAVQPEARPNVLALKYDPNAKDQVLSSLALPNRRSKEFF